jgi:Ras-related protein Rab-5C
MRFIQGTFKQDMSATIDAAFAKVLMTPNNPVRLQLWDTFGQEKFRSFVSMYYFAVFVAVRVSDVTDKRTLDCLKELAAEIVGKAPPGVKLFVLGNTIDLIERRIVSSADGENLARHLSAEKHPPQ